MADPGITSGQLIRDWYDRFVVKKPLADSLSPSNPSYSSNLPMSPTPSTPPPQTPVNPPMEAPSAAPAPTAPTEGGSSWSDNLNAGMQDPAKVGLLGAGLSMMSTPPRSTPYSGAEIIGNAGLAGLNYFQKAVDDKRKQQAMDVSQEEHTLNRQMREDFNRGRLEDMVAKREIETRKEASQAKIRTANALYRDAQRGKVEALNSLVDPDWAEAMGHPEWGGMTYDQIHGLSSPITQEMKGKTAETVQKIRGATAEKVQEMKGATAESVQKARGETTKTVQGMKKTAGAKGGGSEKLFQYQDRKATESLKQKGVANPTVEQIAAERQALFPKGTPKAAINDPLSSLLGPAKTGNEYLKQATTRDQAKERIRKMSEAGYTRQQIEEALKGTQWQ